MDPDRSPSPRTTRDALTVELLGDVGRLHELIKGLPDGLRTSLAPTLGAIALASREARGAVAESGKAEKAAFVDFTTSEKIALRDSLKAALRDEAGAVLADAVRELQLSARVHVEAASAQRRQGWRLIAVALTVGIASGGLGFCASHLLFG